MSEMTMIERQQAQIDHMIESLQAIKRGERKADWSGDTSIKANLRELARHMNEVALAEYPDTFREWMEGHFEKGELKDMYEHGVDAGWSHLTYYHQTAILYDKYEDEIWEAVVEDADVCGYENAMAFIASWKTEPDGDVEFKNALVWYMAERTVRDIVESDDFEDED